MCTGPSIEIDERETASLPALLERPCTGKAVGSIRSWDRRVRTEMPVDFE